MAPALTAFLPANCDKAITPLNTNSNVDTTAKPRPKASGSTSVIILIAWTIISIAPDIARILTPIFAAFFPAKRLAAIRSANMPKIFMKASIWLFISLSFSLDTFSNTPIRRCREPAIATIVTAAPNLTFLHAMATRASPAIIANNKPSVSVGLSNLSSERLPIALVNNFMEDANDRRNSEPFDNFGAALLNTIANAVKPSPRTPNIFKSLSTKAESRFSIAFNANIRIKIAPAIPVKDNETFPTFPILPEIAENANNPAAKTPNTLTADHVFCKSS